MRAKQTVTCGNRRARSGRRAAAVALLLACTVTGADASSQQNRFDRRSPDRLEDAPREEGEALLNLADAAMSVRTASDFAIRWSNDFFKAQTGTFVPFTITIDRSSVTATNGLLYSSSGASRWRNGPFARRRHPVSLRCHFSGGAFGAGRSAGANYARLRRYPGRLRRLCRGARAGRGSARVARTSKGCGAQAAADGSGFLDRRPDDEHGDAGRSD